MLAHKSYMHPMTIASLPCPKCEKIFESQLAFKKTHNSSSPGLSLQRVSQETWLEQDAEGSQEEETLQ